MKDALTEMVGSKKWIATMVAVLFALAAKKIGVEHDIALAVLGLIGVAVGSQAVVDHGATAAQITASAAPAAPPAPPPA